MNSGNSFARTVLLLLLVVSWASFAHLHSPVTHTVTISDMKFEPPMLEVNPGDRVKFVNKDMVIHNVTEENKSWASPTIPPGSSWVLEVKGPVNYYCSFHPMMKGKLRLKK